MSLAIDGLVRGLSLSNSLRHRRSIESAEMQPQLQRQKSTPPMGSSLANKRSNRLPPLILVQGNDNAFSIARSLGRRSVPIYVLNGPRAEVNYSRYVRRLPIASNLPFREAVIDFLTSSASDPYLGSVLLAASDEALEMIAHHRSRLAKRFLLDLSDPVAQLKMLDKLATYRVAEQAGVPTPRFWEVSTNANLENLRRELVYPLIVKPLLSHDFQKTFSSNEKFFVANSFEEVLAAVQRTQRAEIDVLLLEMVPGPDSALCSYYTYLDEQGQPLFDFTKRIIRRYPKNMGLATYHVTDHVPEVRELALRLFQSAGLRGLANAEFKLDARDGTLKLIECNARFTAANGLVSRAGIDLAQLVYNRIVGLPLPPLDTYRDNVTMWDPLRDYRAYQELRETGELSFAEWLRSILRPHVFPCFDWRDPIPALVRLWRRCCRRS